MNKERLMITVIVPVYNAEAYLEKCLDSITNQDYLNLEIILIDDGSTDSSLSICEGFAAKDKRITLIHQENQGLVCTRRTGMNMASGDYISFVDADDFIESDMFSVLVKLIDDSLPDMIAFGLEEVYSNHVYKRSNHFANGFYNRELLEGEIFPSMLSYNAFFDFGILPNLVCKLIKRSFWLKGRIHVSDIVTVGEDADLSFQLLAQANSLEIINICPYHYCKRENSMMWKKLDVAAIYALEDDLKKGFTDMGIYSVMKKQLKDYITFVKLLKNPQSVDRIDIEFTKENNRIALYGAGGFGQALYAQYKSVIPVWTDKNYTICTQKGLPVICIDEFIKRQNEYDVVYIAILNSELCEQIREFLIQNGLEKEVIYFTNNS